jgi:hypothetical protein
MPADGMLAARFARGDVGPSRLKEQLQVKGERTFAPKQVRAQGDIVSTREAVLVTRSLGSEVLPFHLYKDYRHPAACSL